MSTRWEPPLWYDRLAGGAWRFLVIVGAVGVSALAIIALSSIILPIVLGLLFACGLHPVYRRLRDWRIPAVAAAALSVLLIVGTVALVAWLMVRTVVDQWDDLVQLIGQGRDTLAELATDLGITESTAEASAEDATSFVNRAIDLLLGGLVAIVPATATIVATLLLSFIVAYFFLKDGGAMWAWLLSRMGAGAAVTDRVGTKVWRSLSAFIVGQTVIAFIDAAGITLGAIVLGIPEVGAVFVLTFVGAYIPFIGAFLSGMVAVLLALGDSGLEAGLFMLAIVVAVQLVEGNVLQPWIQGRAMRLHPLVIALSVTAGGALCGFLGVFLAVPLTAAAIVTVSELRDSGVLGRGRPLATAEPGVQPDT